MSGGTADSPGHFAAGQSLRHSPGHFAAGQSLRHKPDYYTLRVKFNRSRSDWNVFDLILAISSGTSHCAWVIPSDA